MSEPADIAARTQRFNQAVRAFVPPAPARHAQLMPMKDGISELRLEGASLRLIRELFATPLALQSAPTRSRVFSRR